MISQDRDYEDILRDALRAAAESVEPASDGLERIRHRSHSRRSARWTLVRAADWLRLYRIRLSVRLESFRWQLSDEAGEQFPRARSWPARVVTLAVRAVTPRPSGHDNHDGRTPSGKTAGRLGPAAAWLKPALAVGAVVAVVVGGVIALNRSQETVITPTNSVTSPGQQHDSAAAGLATPGLWQPPIGVKTRPGVSGAARKKGTSALPAVACTPTPSPSSSPAPTASASATPTPTPSNTATATPSATPTDTGSPSATPTTGTGGSTASATADVAFAPNTDGGTPDVTCGTLPTRKTPRATS